jgi:adenylylsulfate kinase-like enzyme
MNNSRTGCVIWLTGLSGAGKSTIAKELECAMLNSGKSAVILDGDKVRRGLCSDLTFSPHDRMENVRRIGEVAKLCAEAGLVCIVALISPYRNDRQVARSIVKKRKFIEIYINAPIKEFTGVSAPYEPPVNPEIEVPTDKLTIVESVDRILDFLDSSGINSSFPVSIANCEGR